jgi:PAS domain S-box-containing protein
MNKNYLDQIFMKSPFPWWEWNIIENKVDFNDLKATMLGYKPEDFRNQGYQTFTELLHEEDFEKTMDAMRLVLRGQTDLYPVDYRMKAKDGRYHWYMDRGIVIDRDDKGDIKILRGIVIDLGSESSAGVPISALVDLFKNTTFNKGSSVQSILTLCSNCQKAQIEKNHWIPISEEIESLLGEMVSHGICPDCIQKLYPEISESLFKKLHLSTS